MNNEPMRTVNPEANMRALAHTHPVNETFSTIKVNESVGTAFLGILTILMLVFLVRSNRRNRELLLEVISLRRQP